MDPRFARAINYLAANFRLMRKRRKTSAAEAPTHFKKRKMYMATLDEDQTSVLKLKEAFAQKESDLDEKLRTSDRSVMKLKERFAAEKKDLGKKLNM